MSRRSEVRRLIVNADDFGRSKSINSAVIRAHREGILTTTSLMVNEPAFEHAVALARENPQLGVGLHLTFVCGHSALNAERIPGLVNARNEFSDNPAQAGFRYFFQRSLREQLRDELRLQFRRFFETGLPMDHVNGHLHLHLHPTIFKLLMNDAADLGIQRMRLTFDPFWLNLRLASGNLGYKVLHTLVFQRLANRARPVLQRRGVSHTNAVFGLLQNARVDEAYVAALLNQLPPGDSELYSHPSLHEFRNEFEALISPTVQERIQQLGIRLIRYQDL
jgi:hopanoid biosynthesis associated protein HpnK